MPIFLGQLNYVHKITRSLLLTISFQVICSNRSSLLRKRNEFTTNFVDRTKTFEKLHMKNLQRWFRKNCIWRIYSVDYGITDFLSGAGKTSNTIYERSRWLPYGVSALRYNTAMPCWLIQKAYLSSWITVRSELINMHVWFVITSRIIDSSWRRAKTERHRHSSKNDTNN
jgi:hypothetical protein